MNEICMTAIRGVATVKMNKYLEEIEHAVVGALEILWADVEKLDEQRQKTAALTASTLRGYQQADFLSLNPDLDDEGLGTFTFYDTYFGPDKERSQSETAEEVLAERIATLEFSNGAMAGSILQYAKQAISIAHHGLAGCPDGRAIGSQTVKTVIWQARNQAMHWDEGHLNASVVACFTALATDFAPVYLDYHSKSLAFEVVQLLDWRNLERFRADLELLA